MPTPVNQLLPPVLSLVLLQGLINRSADKQIAGIAVRSPATQQALAQQHRSSAATCTASHQLAQPRQKSQPQQPVQSDETSLPGSQLIAAHDDRESYQGRVGRTVTLPKKGTPLWHAAFNGNVPTQWWLDRSNSSCDLLGSAAAGASTDAKQNSVNSSKVSISSWSDLVAQSAYIQKAFRLAGPMSPLFHWRQGWLLPGRQGHLGSYRAHSPCPRASINRINTHGRMLSLSQLDCHHEPQRAACLRKAHLHRRWRWSLIKKQHGLEGSLSAYRLRSHKHVAARHTRDRWRRRQPSKTPGSSNSPNATICMSVMPVVLRNDVVPSICSESAYKHAQQFAATICTVTRCVAGRDEQGRNVPLPEGCTGAGCNSSCGMACSTSSSNIEQQQQQPAEHDGDRRACLDSQLTCSTFLACSSDDDAEVGRQSRPSLAACTAPAITSSASRQEDASEWVLPAEQIKQQHQQHMRPEQDASGSHQAADPAGLASRPCQQVLELPSSAVEALGVSIQQIDEALRGARITVTAAALETADDTEDLAHSESDWESGNDSDAGYSDSDEDCITDEEPVDLRHFFDSIQLSADTRVAINAAIHEPHVFRNDSDIIYGFWSKCPLG